MFVKMNAYERHQTSLKILWYYFFMNIQGNLHHENIPAYISCLLYLEQ